MLVNRDGLLDQNLNNRSAARRNSLRRYYILSVYSTPDALPTPTVGHLSIPPLACPLCTGLRQRSARRHCFHCFAVPPCLAPLCPIRVKVGAHSLQPCRGLEQEQAVPGVLDDPSQPLLQILPRHGAARHDGPLVRRDAVELQPLLRC